MGLLSWLFSKSMSMANRAACRDTGTEPQNADVHHRYGVVSKSSTYVMIS